MANSIFGSLVEKLTRLLEEVNEPLIDGSLDDYESYREQVGRGWGLRMAIFEVVELEKRLRKQEDKD